eukprot:9488632-Pyramimonas_sp.AAC.2
MELCNGGRQAVPLAGQTAAELRVGEVEGVHAGVYICLIKNDLGEAETDCAAVFVRDENLQVLRFQDMRVCPLDAIHAHPS